MLCQFRCFLVFGVFALIAACNSSGVEESLNKEVVTVDVHPQNLSISFAGFFNSESRDFSPAPIGYAGVDYGTVLAAMKSQAEAKGLIVPNFGEVDSIILKTTSRDAIDDSIDAMLVATNDWLQTTDKTCSKCSSIEGFDITSIEKYRTWTDEDRVMFVWGLETLAPNSNGLRSGFGIFLFDPAGNYVRHIFKEYNFSNYTTEPFKADMISIIDEYAKTL